MRFWLCVWLALPAWAADGLPLPVAALARRADLIVRAKVESKSVRQNAQGQIRTEVKLLVREVWKGDPRQPLLTVVQGGGILGEKKVVVAGQADYAPGEEIVGFYVWNARGEAVTLGLGQGKIPVDSEPPAKIAALKALALEAAR
jgi:hypothetical protein